MPPTIEDQDDSLFATPGEALGMKLAHMYSVVCAWPEGAIRHRFPTVEPVHEFSRLDGTEVKVYYAWIELSTDGYDWTLLDKGYLGSLIEMLEKP